HGRRRTGGGRMVESDVGGRRDGREQPLRGGELAATARRRAENNFFARRGTRAEAHARGPARAGDGRMIEWSLIFLGGLLGSAHCIGMCGGFAIAIGAGATRWSSNALRQVIYSLGRIT